jgi:hypothetical protein
MMIDIWVFTLLGEPIAQQHGTPYVQVTASSLDHDRGSIREQIEARAWERFHHDFPGVTVMVEEGWHRQAVRVMGDG